MWLFQMRVQKAAEDFSAFLLHIRQVSSSHLGPMTGYPNRDFVGAPKDVQVEWLCNQVTLHLSSSHSALHNPTWVANRTSGNL